MRRFALLLLLALTGCAARTAQIEQFRQTCERICTPCGYVFRCGVLQCRCDCHCSPYGQ